MAVSAPEGRLQARLEDLETGLELQRYDQDRAQDEVKA